MPEYDTKTTVFSPEGKIFQVEYALKAVESAGLCLALKGRESIVLVTENRIQSKLLNKNPYSNFAPDAPTISSISEKVHKIDDHMFVASAGLAPDTETLIDRLRHYASQNYSQMGASINVSQAVRYMADIKQHLTQHGGSRPFGASLVYFGVEDEKLVLFSSNPTGNYEKYHAVAIGNQSSPSISEVDAQLTNSSSSHEYSSQKIEDLPTNELLKLATKVVMTTIGSGGKTVEDGKLEMFVIRRRGDLDNQSSEQRQDVEFEWENANGADTLDINVLTPSEINRLIDEHFSHQTNGHHVNGNGYTQADLDDY